MSKSKRQLERTQKKNRCIHELNAENQRLNKVVAKQAKLLKALRDILEEE